MADLWSVAYVLGVLLLLLAQPALRGWSRHRDPQEKPWRTIGKELSYGLQFRKDKYVCTVVIPALAAIVLLVILMLAFPEEPGRSADRSVALAFVVSVGLAPLFEEGLFRGVIFGGIVAGTYGLCQKIQNNRTRLLRGGEITGIILATGGFLAIHDLGTPLQVAARLGGGILYGVLYVMNDRNLLPPTVAHGMYNALVIAISP